MAPEFPLALVPVGKAGDFLNVLVGGGSLLTMPTLVFPVFHSAVPNGINGVAVFFKKTLLLSTIFAVLEFSRAR